MVIQIPLFTPPSPNLLNFIGRACVIATRFGNVGQMPEWIRPCYLFQQIETDEEDITV